MLRITADQVIAPNLAECIQKATRVARLGPMQTSYSASASQELFRLSAYIGLARFPLPCGTLVYWLRSRPHEYL